MTIKMGGLVNPSRPFNVTSLPLPPTSRYWMPSMWGMVAKPTSSSSSVGMWSVISPRL